jgi:glycosyltransferase involved in cell wall biosynthesis
VIINAALVSSPVRRRGFLTYIYDLVDDPFSSGEYRTDMIRRRFINRELGKADTVTACSLTLAEYASDTWDREVLYLPNGTDVSSFRSVSDESVAELKKRWGIEGQKVIAFISNFEPWNGLLFLSRVFRKLSDERDDVVLLLVGSGKGLDGVRHEYESMRNVIVTGSVPPEQVAAYFRTADVGVLPFDQCDLTDRALPIKILEYGAARKHVVAAPLTELKRQNFPNVCLVEKDVHLWTKAIDSAIAADWNPEWDEVYCGYDWKEIVRNRLVPRIEGTAGTFKDQKRKLVREPDGILSNLSRI